MAIGTKNAVVQGCGTHHIAVQTRDWDESLSFYQDVLGMERVAEFGGADRKIVLLDVGDGSHIELFQPTADSPAAGAESPNDPVTHFALATTDARAATETRPSSGCQNHGGAARCATRWYQRDYRFFHGS